MKYRLKIWRRQLENEAGRAGCYLFHNLIGGHWAQFIGSHAKYCCVCGRKWR
jgi:hypothetical protein